MVRGQGSAQTAGAKGQASGCLLGSSRGRIPTSPASSIGRNALRSNPGSHTARRVSVPCTCSYLHTLGPWVTEALYLRKRNVAPSAPSRWRCSGRIRAPLPPASRLWECHLPSLPPGPWSSKSSCVCCEGSGGGGRVTMYLGHMPWTKRRCQPPARTPGRARSAQPSAVTGSCRARTCPAPLTPCPPSLLPADDLSSHIFRNWIL